MSITTEAMSAVFRALIFITLAVTLYLGAWLVFDVRRYIDVRTIDIEPVLVGSMPMVEVGRSVHKRFFGGYEVTIREALTGHIVCTTGEVDAPYEPESEPLVKSLAWWAAGGSCDPVIAGGLSAARYSMVTCHYVRHPWVILPQKSRCVGPTAFRIYAATEPLPEPIEQSLHNLESKINRIEVD